MKSLLIFVLLASGLLAQTKKSLPSAILYQNGVPSIGCATSGSYGAISVDFTNGIIYVCRSAGWTAVSGGGVTVQANATTIGTRSIVNYVAGTGLIQTLSDNGTAVTVQQAVDTAIIQTVPAGQSGTSLLCSSAGASATTFTCTMAPVLTAYTTGMIVNWRPDVSATAGAVTINVDTLGAKAIRRDDGSTNPATGDLVAGRLYRLWYDGTVFRYVAPAASSQTVTLSVGGCPSSGSGVTPGVWFGVPAISCGGNAYNLPALGFNSGALNSKAVSPFLSANVSFVAWWYSWLLGSNPVFTLETSCRKVADDIDTPGMIWNTAQSVTLTGIQTAYIIQKTETVLTTTGCAVGDLFMLRVSFTTIPGGVFMANPHLVFN